MSRATGYDASQSASTKVSRRVKLDAAFALLAAAGHLGRRFFGRHYTGFFKSKLDRAEEESRQARWSVWKAQWLAQRVAGRLVVVDVGCRRAG